MESGELIKVWEDEYLQMQSKYEQGCGYRLLIWKEELNVVWNYNSGKSDSDNNSGVV